MSDGEDSGDEDREIWDGDARIMRQTRGMCRRPRARDNAAELSASKALGVSTARDNGENGMESCVSSALHCNACSAVGKALLCVEHAQTEQEQTQLGKQ